MYEPMSFYPTSDGYAYLICPEQHQWEKLQELMGNPEWAKGIILRNNTPEQSQALKEKVSEWTVQYTAEELFHLCQKNRVGAAPVFTFDQLASQPHLKAREYYVPHRHPEVGEISLPGAPYHLRKNWWRIRRPAPRLGAMNGRSEAEPWQDSRDDRTAGKKAAPNGSPVDLPLRGVRVLDFSWVWAGPYCTSLMGFLGAEVWKIETAARSDLTRRSVMTPPGMEHDLNRSGYFNQINQCKKSVGINLTSPEGIDLVKRLAAKSDVMISNFGTGVLEKLGLGHEVMQAINPNLIVAAISAFGQTGPCKSYMGYGPLILPLTGISAFTGYGDGEPRDVGLAYGDPNGGVLTAFSIMASLFARDGADGLGQVIDLSMWEAMLSVGFEGWMGYQLGNPDPQANGNRDPVFCPHNVYPGKGEDRWVAIEIIEEAQWQNLCRVLGRQDWAGDPRFQTAAGRKAHEPELDRAISDWCRVRDRWEATRELQAGGVPAFPSLSNEDMVKDPHLNQRGCFSNWEHAEVGVRTLMGQAWQWENRPNGLGRQAPLLGEHTDQVLEDVLGLDAAERERLRAAGVIE